MKIGIEEVSGSFSALGITIYVFLASLPEGVFLLSVFNFCIVVVMCVVTLYTLSLWRSSNLGFMK